MRLRLLLIAAFAVAAILPIDIFVFWPGSKAQDWAVGEVSERHLPEASDSRYDNYIAENFAEVAAAGGNRTSRFAEPAGAGSLGAHRHAADGDRMDRVLAHPPEARVPRTKAIFAASPARRETTAEAAGFRFLGLQPFTDLVAGSGAGPGSGRSVVVAHAGGEPEAGTAGTHSFALSAMLVAIAGSVLLGWIVRGVFNRPVREFAQTVQKIARGGLDVRVPDPPWPRPKELSDVVRTFNGILDFVQDNNELFQGVFSQAAIGIALTGPDRKIVQANQKICEFLGYGPEELFGTTLRAATHPDFVPQVDELIRKLVEGKVESATVETLYLRKDGTTVWGEWTSSVIRDENGALKLFISIIQNIDDRKRAEAEARETAELLANSQRIAHLGSWDLDIVEDRERWSDEVYRIFGLEPQSIEFTGYGFLDYVHPEDREKAKAAQDDAIAQHKPYSVEYRLIRPDGTERTVYEYGELKFDDRGMPVRLRGTIQDITERRQAEIALQRTTQQLTEAQRLAHVGHWEWDPDGDKSEWSDETFRIFGLEPSDQAPTHQAFFKSILHPADHAMLNQAMDETLRTGKPYTREFRIIRPDRDVRTVRESCERYVPGPSDRPRLRGVLQDITELKHAEASLRETGRRLEIAQRQAKVGYWRWSFADERLTYWSEEAARISRYPVERGPLGYDAVMAPIHPDDRSRVEAEFAAADAEPRDFSVEYRVVHADGRITHVREIGEVEYDENGDPVGHVGFVQDITELKRMEEELRKSEQRLNAFFAEAPAGLALYDGSGRFIKVNDTLARLAGLPAEAHVGRRPSEVLHPAWARQIEESNQQVLQTGIPQVNVEMSALRRTAQGEMGHYVFSRFPIPGPEGRPLGVGSVVVDITDHKRAEDELRQAQKMEAVGQLTGGIAHDFNNLLAIILGNLELVASRLVPDDSSRRQLETAIKATERGANLTQRLLAFSRKQALQPVPVDARKLIDGMLDLLRRSLGEMIEIEIVADGRLWTTEVDPGQLESAILNLAINARDAMPGGGRLTITASNARLPDRHTAAPRDVAPGQYVMVAVSDTGKGMSPEMRDRVFEPFFTTKTDGKGTGLGLSMVHGFVKQSGGHVAICSESGKGTTVRLYIPRYRGEEAVVERRGNVSESASGSGEVILVVEDNPDLRTMTVNMLRSLGYDVLEAGSAQHALEVLDDAPGVNLLLTDVVLPGGASGRVLADWTRQRGMDLPILYMSGYTANAVIRDGRLDDGVRLLEKPFRRASLARAVRQALEARAA